MTNAALITGASGGIGKEFACIHAGLEGVEAFKNAATPESVARVGYNAMQKGKLVVINDWKLSLLLNWVMPLLPRKMVLRTSRQSMEKS